MRTIPSPAPRPLWRRSGLRLGLLVGGAALLTSGCDARELYEDTFSIGFPDPVTDQGDRILDLWLGSMAAATVVGLFVLGLILWACVAFRKRSDELPRQVRYNLPIEVIYTVIPMVIVAVLFYYTAVDQNYINEESENPDVTIGVVGFQWNWTFNHLGPDGQVIATDTGEPSAPATLVLPTDRTIRFEETSNDVIHSFFVPKFLFKRDVIPGRVNSFEITIHTAGEYIGRCAELCGEKHDRMNFVVRAVTPDQYATYLAQQAAIIAADPLGPPAAGPAAATQLTESKE